MGYIFGVQSNQYKSLNITIDGVEIDSSQILSLTIDWNMDSFKIIGGLMISDKTSLVESIPIRGNNIVNINITDFDNINFNQEFIVIDISYTRDVTDGHIAILSLIDPITISATQMFNGMSWKKASIIDIIDHSETLKPLLKKKKKDFFSPKEKSENFVIPLNVSFNVILHWLSEQNNVFIFQNRKNFIIQPLKELFSRNKKGDKFYYKTPNAAYRNRVYEYHVSYGSLIERNLVRPNADISSFSAENKGKENISIDANKAGLEIKSKGKTIEKLPGTGNKQFYRADNHSKSASDNLWQKSAYKSISLQILCAGKFDNNIGDIIEIDLKKDKDETKPEQNLNGEWLIQNIKDIFTNNEFVQKMVLVRNKFST